MMMTFGAGFAALVLVLGVIASAFAVIMLETSTDTSGKNKDKNNGDNPVMEYWNETYNYEDTYDLGDEHHKHHWMLNDSAVKVTAVLKWEDTLQDLDFAIGKGDCPHHGETAAEDNNGSAGNGEGRVVLEVDDPDILFVKEGSQEKWFAHIEADPAAVECHYSVEVRVSYAREQTKEGE